MDEEVLGGDQGDTKSLIGAGQRVADPPERQEVDLLVHARSARARARTSVSDGKEAW